MALTNRCKNILIITIALASVSAIISVGILLFSGDESSNIPPRNCRRDAQVEIQEIGTFEVPKAPLYDAARDLVFFADMSKSQIVSWKPGSRDINVAKVDGPNKDEKAYITFVAPINSSQDEYIITYGSDIATVKWDGKSNTTTNFRKITAVDDNVFRANNGIVAPSGNIFIGTHSPNKNDGKLDMSKAALYSFSVVEKQTKKILEKVTIGNGMAWSKDNKKFYFVDSKAYTVEGFDYNITDDTLCNRELILNYQNENIEGVPDGMTIDSEDKLWVTTFNGNVVNRVCPKTKKIIAQYVLKANKITSNVFVNDKYYIFTGNWKNTPEQMASYPLSGHVLLEKTVNIGGCPGKVVTSMK